MGKITNYIKKIQNVKDEQDLSELIDVATELVDKKIVELQKENESSAIDPVIIKDENGAFIDCCNVVKPNSPQAYFSLASNILKEVSKKEKDIKEKFRRYTILFYTILMLFYTVFSIVHISNFGEESKVVMWVFIGLFLLLFVVMTLINLYILKNSKNTASRKIKMIKNYKSVSTILRRLMLLWSLGITIYSMTKTWHQGLAYQITNIAMLTITSLFVIYIIYREVRKIRRRIRTPKQSKLKVIFGTIKKSVKETTTASYISPNKSNPIQQTSSVKEKFASGRYRFFYRKNKKANKASLKRAYREKYKEEAKKLKDRYRNDIDKL